MTTKKVSNGWVVEISNEFIRGRRLVYWTETLEGAGLKYEDDPTAEFLPRMSTERYLTIEIMPDAVLAVGEAVNK